MRNKKLSTLFDKSDPGKTGYILPTLDVPKSLLGKHIDKKLLKTTSFNMPQLTEPEVVRHFVNLSVKNHHVDKDFYPLGSCTMKYNPKINDIIASISGFSGMHPGQLDSSSQGSLKLMSLLQEMLLKITGMDAITLQPSAGSQGEFAGILVINKYHQQKGNNKKTIIIPESAHGTNPASVVLGGYEPVKVGTNSRGRVDIDDLMKKVNKETAGMMLTQPNTLGLFEDEIEKISEIIHKVDGLMYMDGANLNALMGIARPFDMGFDITHINLHKTFSTPHGGGGPGAGPICVIKKLSEFLPIPRIIKNKNTFELCYDRDNSIGQLHSFYGNFLVLTRAYCYILSLGDSGLERMSKIAILNANYVAHRLKEAYDILHTGENGLCGHEFIIDLRKYKKLAGITEEDIAKRLQDFNIHAPTMSWPVPGTIMIEPTESESKRELDRFCEAMITIRSEIDDIINGKSDRDNNVLKGSPHTADSLIKDDWKNNYSREQAAYPLSYLKTSKFWPSVGRIDNVYGDVNFMCQCPPMSEYIDD